MKPRKPLKVKDAYMCFRPSGELLSMMRYRTVKEALTYGRIALYEHSQLDYTPEQFYARGYTVRKVRMIEVEE